MLHEQNLQKCSLQPKQVLGSKLKLEGSGSNIHHLPLSSEAGTFRCGNIISSTWRGHRLRRLPRLRFHRLRVGRLRVRGRGRTEEELLLPRSLRGRGLAPQRLVTDF